MPLARIQFRIAWAASAALALATLVVAAEVTKPDLYPVGAAKIDVTPDYPVRLSGYAVRKAESEGVIQHLYAKALAFGSDADQPAILITVDNCGVPGNVRDEVVKRLKEGRQIRQDRVAICSTHTHSAPWLRGYLPNLFGAPLPPDQEERVVRYTREMTDALEKVALRALADRRPSTLAYGKGHAEFAANRRTKGGPVDQEVPVLFVFGPGGALRAVLASYACHCTTLGGESNSICGDWAGFAQEFMESDHPGVIGLISLGCGADANPNPRSTLELAKQYGRQVASAANAVLSNTVPVRIRGKLRCRTEQLELPFDTLPSRAEWEARAKTPGYPGSHARLNLARLDRGEKLPTALSYMVQAWRFGADLDMVFLPGEVVVDYSLRLKREFEPGRIWVNAYANDVPCYIPSERVLREGGYEGGGAMIYYDKPNRFAPGLESRIIESVHQLVRLNEQSQPK